VELCEFNNLSFVVSLLYYSSFGISRFGFDPLVIFSSISIIIYLIVMDPYDLYMHLGGSRDDDHQHVHVAIRTKDISMGRKVYTTHTNNG